MIWNCFYAQVNTTLLLYLRQIFTFLLGHLHFFLHFFFAFMENLFKKHPIFCFKIKITIGAPKEIQLLRKRRFKDSATLLASYQKLIHSCPFLNRFFYKWKSSHPWLFTFMAGTVIGMVFLETHIITVWLVPQFCPCILLPNKFVHTKHKLRPASPLARSFQWRHCVCACVCVCMCAWFSLISARLSWSFWLHLCVSVCVTV